MDNMLKTCILKYFRPYSISYMYLLIEQIVTGFLLSIGTGPGPRDISSRKACMVQLGKKIGKQKQIK